MDFGNEKFNNFTENSIGERVQEKLNDEIGEYTYSKGKSFDYFIDNSDDNKIYKLIKDLHDYLTILVEDKSIGNQYEDLLVKSTDIIIELEEEYTELYLDPLSEKLKVYFDDKLISRQIELMIEEIYTSPNNAIGKSKNLVETCFKYVL